MLGGKDELFLGLQSSLPQDLNSIQKGLPLFIYIIEVITLGNKDNSGELT